MKIVNLYLLILFSCLLNAQSKISLEGKWKVTDLIIIEDNGSNWTKEISEIDDILDYQLEFTTYNTFKDNKEQLFKPLNNLTWNVINNEDNLVIGLKKDTNDSNYEAIFKIITYDNKSVFCCQTILYSNLKKFL